MRIFLTATISMCLIVSCALNTDHVLLEDSSNDIYMKDDFPFLNRHKKYIEDKVIKWWSGEVEVTLKSNYSIAGNSLNKGDKVIFSSDGKLFKIISESKITGYSAKSKDVYCFESGLNEKVIYSYKQVSKHVCSKPRWFQAVSLPPRGYSNKLVLNNAVFERTVHTRCNKTVNAIFFRDIKFKGFQLTKYRSGVLIKDSKEFAVYDDSKKLFNPFKKKYAKEGELVCLNKKDQDSCKIDKNEELGFFEIKRCTYKVTKHND